VENFQVCENCWAVHFQLQTNFNPGSATESSIESFFIQDTIQSIQETCRSMLCSMTRKFTSKRELNGED
jgi:hypothetical protein